MLRNNGNTESRNLDTIGGYANYQSWLEYVKNLPDGEEKVLGSMIYNNKGYYIPCKDCNKRFFISFEENDFFISKSLSTPKRCKICREIRKYSSEMNEYYDVASTMFRENIKRPRTGRQQAYDHFLPNSEF